MSLFNISIYLYFRSVLGVGEGLEGNREMNWSGRRDSNSRQLAWEARTLPTELHPQFNYSNPLTRFFCRKSKLTILSVDNLDNFMSVKRHVTREPFNLLIRFCVAPYEIFKVAVVCIVPVRSVTFKRAIGRLACSGQ